MNCQKEELSREIDYINYLYIYIYIQHLYFTHNLKYK